MGWKETDLAAIGGSHDFKITAGDGSPKRTTVWVVRAGDDLYVRPYFGTGSRWYAAATRDPRGQVHAGGTSYDVTLEILGDAAPNDAIDDAYRAKYGHGGEAQYVPPMIGRGPRVATVRLLPR